MATNYTAKVLRLRGLTLARRALQHFTDFADLTFSNATVTARGALIFNDSASGDPAVCALDFGGDKTSTAGDFTIQFPTADASNAIIRIAYVAQQRRMTEEYLEWVKQQDRSHRI